MPTPIATFTYDSLSHRTNLALGDGSSVSYTYDPAKADLTQISHQFVGAGSFSFSYDSTATHQRRYSNVSDTSLVWPHPALGTTTYSPQPVSATNYDQITGITTMPADPTSATTTTSIGYDGRGNVTCTGTISVLQPCVGNSYTFDSENHLTTAVSSGFNASYAYDPLGRRQSKNVNGTITQFVDDDRASMQRFDIELFVIHPTLAPAEITRALGLEPRHSHGVGERRRTPKREIPGTYPDTRWRYSRRFEAEGQWFQAQVAEFVAALAPHRAFLEQVRSSGGRTSLILQFLGDGYYGDTLSLATLEGISSLGLDMGLEVYGVRQNP